MASLLRLSLALLAIIASNPALAGAKPPPPPVRCNATGCVVSNAYGAWGDRTECPVGRVVYPTSEDELLAAVAHASARRLKVKVATGFSHTIPKLACPPPEDSVVISTARYNARVTVDPAARTVTADSGVGLRDLIDAVEAAGMSLVAAPYWEGVSVGGIISTGSHGSSWWGKGGAVHEYVVGLSLVVPAAAAEEHAKVLRLRRGDPLFNAASVSLGLLGVISQVTLSLEPAFKRSITYRFQDDDATLEDEFLDHAKKHEFADITWFPSQHQVAFRLDDRVPLNTSGHGKNDFVGFQSDLISVSELVRATEKGFDETRNVKGKCTTAATVLTYKKIVGTGLKNNLIFTGYPVVGRQGQMQTSGSCQHSPAADILDSCAWDPRINGLFFYETTAFFSASKFRDFVVDVKKLRDLKGPENFCGVDSYNGIMVRFVKKSEALLGQPEDAVVVDFNYYRASDPAAPRLNQDVWEEVEQMAFFKHGARPHWAKNRRVAFRGVREKYPGFGEFMAAMEELDPQGMFRSPWSDEVIGGGEAAGGDGCALEGQCVCSEDRHCSPSKGYLCKPGLVYEEARVCRYTDPKSME